MPSKKPRVEYDDNGQAIGEANPLADGNKKVRGRKVTEVVDENTAMAQMIESLSWRARHSR